MRTINAVAVYINSTAVCINGGVVCISSSAVYSFISASPDLETGNKELRG